MSFRTKLDYSSNRQIKQYPETLTVLSGGTSFGMTFSALTSGPDLSTSGVSQTYTSIGSTFSGNSGTTVYTWYDPRMSLGESALSALTPSNSGITQNTGHIYSASSATTIDGNVVNLSYTGVSFDISNIAMMDLGGGVYSGTVVSLIFDVLSANTSDFTGRTIWVDVSGITRTEDLIVTSNPTIGYVLTCVDAEGRAEWGLSSGSTGGTSYWSASSGTNAIVVKNSGSLASGDNSLAEGFYSTASGNYSHAEGSYASSTDLPTVASGVGSHAEGMSCSATTTGAHAEGFSTISSGNFGSHSEGNSTIASGQASHAEGGSTIASGTSSHAEGTSTVAGGVASHAEGSTTKALGDYSHAEGSQTTASGDYSHAEGRNTTASGGNSHAEGFFSIASGSNSHAEGRSTTAIGLYSHASGSGSTASGTTSFVHGNRSIAAAESAIVLGDNITGSTANYTYVESLNIKTVGSAAFTNDIRIDGNGNLTTNTSDIRLKENINTVENALDKIKQLRGVTYQWRDKSAGGADLRIGFIAQEVEKVDPLLVFKNKNDGYLGLHIDGIIPLLVEAVKELAEKKNLKENVYLETQTILAEDNNIELNYNGNSESAIGGGVKVLHSVEQNKSSEIVTDKNGNWVTNNEFIPQGLVIPEYTPSSSDDEHGITGNITRDDDYLYVKTINGWKRSNLESF